MDSYYQLMCSKYHVWSLIFEKLEKIVITYNLISLPIILFSSLSILLISLLDWAKPIKSKTDHYKFMKWYYESNPGFSKNFYKNGSIDKLNARLVVTRVYAK